MSSVTDPMLLFPLDPESVSGIWNGKNSDTGFGIRDEHPRTFSRRLRNSFSGLKYLKFFDADPDPGPRIQDPGWKNSDPGSGKNIPDLQHCLVSIIHMVLEDGLIEDVFLK